LIRSTSVAWDLNLRTHPGPGEIGTNKRVTFAGDEGSDRYASGHTGIWDVVAVPIRMIRDASAGVVDLGGPMAVAILAQWRCDVDKVAALIRLGEVSCARRPSIASCAIWPR
jgi:hypothetical protein